MQATVAVSSGHDKSFGLFDEPSEAEYIRVLDVLRTHVNELYAFDPRVDLSTDSSTQLDYRLSQGRLSALPWVDQMQLNTLWDMNLHIPNKTSRETYFKQLIQESSEPDRLDRYAHVIIFHGANQPAEVREYIVGPMHLNKMTVTVTAAHPYLKRPLGGAEYGALLDFLAIICDQLRPILQLSYDASYFMSGPTSKWLNAVNLSTSDRSAKQPTRCQSSVMVENVRGKAHCLIPSFASPLVTSSNPRARRIWFRLVRQVAPFIQYPVDIQFEIDITSLNPQGWTLNQIWFQGRTYTKVTEMLDLHKAGSLHIVPQPFIDLYPQQMRYGPGQIKKNENGAGLPVNAAILPTSFLTTATSGFKRRQQSQPESAIPVKLDHVQKPSSPLFVRNRIQIAGRRVKCQSWDFHLTLRKDTGLRIYGVYFAGHSIIAEAGLDETVTSYWGYSPFMRAMTSLESMYGVGAMSSELSPGIDCPKEAVYLPVQLVLSGEAGPKMLKHGICLFDWLVQPPGGPLRRHFEFPGDRPEASGGSKTTEHTNFAFGMPSRALVVRSIASIFNYDYLFDIVFHASGVIEFSVTPTGYIHVDTVPPNLFSNPTNQSWYEKSAFGFVSNTMPLYFVAHQHLFHYKIDIDLHSSRNFVKVIDVHGPVNHPGHPIPGPPVSAPPTLWTSSQIPRSELEARFHTQFEYPKQYLVCETQREEKKENPQCVGLINKGAIITLASHEHTRSYAWSRYQLVVTRQHDSEPYASSIFNGVDLTSPTVDFEAFSLDNESIYNEDIVLWLTVGNIHLPRHEDLPNTVTTGGRLSFFIQPHNLFKHSPDAYSCDRVYTNTLEEWLKGFSEPSFCHTETVPTL
ncbi:hypothetical protein CRM22_008022 [Opisthorchis felineus]|uniref:Amine oxidase n=1 Tax=Opisthorchis felineus TaxID=147828 RepID=A0A4S2LDI7_OPIFE|nr:hypothetical protein CRM22_008022 [Opisthorchis felineus]TGZ61381.1 hypothetical protein CRM22_008022 [Opisthorchis felineus]TGZ61382.1 hypothetical protein CRM22_008022 [Opisthorchis felineus]